MERLHRAATAPQAGGMNTHARNSDSYKIAPAPDSVPPGLVFLLRASARFDLVEAGAMEIEEAIMGLAPAFYQLVHPMCDCSSIIYERMERLYLHIPPKPKLRRVR